MNQRVSSGSSDGLVEANSKDLPTRSSAPDDPTHRRSIASEQLCQRRCNGYVTWRAPDEPMLSFSGCRFFGCLGLFIPPPLTHLKMLDCVEVQESARNLEDHIQSIQVLNCSFIGLHMLSVCA
jgi:hypothetical protein